MEIVKYKVNEAEIAKMASIYMNLTIKDIDDDSGAAEVHAGRMVMVKHRTSIDKLRKGANADAQAFIKNNNNNAKKLFSLIEPIETHLKNEEGKIEAEKERIKTEKERIEMERNRGRVDALLAVDVVMPFFDVAMMSDEDYGVLFEQATKAKEEKAQIAEEERLAKEKAEKELAEEQAEIERVRAEQEATAKVQAEKEMAIQAKLDAIEAAEKKKAESKERKSLEKRLAKEAKIKAEKDAKERVEREAREKKEKEKAEALEKARQEELRPDKEKLLLFADKIQSLTDGNLSVESPEARAIFDNVVSAILSIEEYFRSKIEEL